ncbi:imidazolonepropionase [Arthrobacter sp. UM1]|nr:imidazolonepropionase [Arthrobacter sp. UM1]
MTDQAASAAPNAVSAPKGDDASPAPATPASNPGAGAGGGASNPAAPASLLVTGISELWTMDEERSVVENAAVLIEGETIAWVGPASKAPDADERLDVEGRAVLPGWVDSHSHLVFAGDRSKEFQARMAGESYSAGGIGVTTGATREASDETLRALVAGRVEDSFRGGTTTLETKTGYGLNVEDEARSARIAAELVDDVTFLGAHLVPAEYKEDPEAYIELVCGPMLDAVLEAAPKEKLRFVDAFCDKGAFTPEQSRRVLEAAMAKGLTPRLHGNQLGETGGAQLALELKAASVDHLNFLSSADIEGLGASGRAFREAGGLPAVGTSAEDVPWPTVATALPACDLSTRAPLTPARELWDAGAVVALASNCNPGTSYTSSMSFCVGTAVLQQHLSLEEALEAATLGGATALRRTDVGRVVPGARADLHILNAPAAIHLAYRPGMPMTWGTVRKGRRVA